MRVVLYRQTGVLRAEGLFPLGEDSLERLGHSLCAQQVKTFDAEGF